MPSLAARNSSTITNATMTTMSNNSLDAATSSTLSSSSASAPTIASVIESETCTYSTATTTTNVVSTASSLNTAQQQQQQQKQQEDYLQQQQQHYQLLQQQQQHHHHHQKYNYYHPPPAVGQSLHYTNNNGGAAVASSAALATTTSSTVAAATTGLATFNGNSNLEIVAANANGNNNNNFNSNYNNGNSSSSSSSTTTNATCSSSSNSKINSTPPPVAAAPLIVTGNSIIGHKTDTASVSCTASGSGCIVGIVPTSAFKNQPQQQQQQLNASREDVASLGGSSSINSQISTNNNNNNPHSNIKATTITTTVNGGGNSSNNNHNLNSILKGSKENLLQNNYCNGSVGGSTTGSEGIGPGSSNIPDHDDPGDGLGPLPPKWETAYTERGELYFIDHNTGTSHWLDPRLSKYQKKSLEECGEDELPYGWEKIEDSLYGTYYIDHVNRKTQYENPVLEAKRRAAEQKQQQQQHHHSHSHSDQHQLQHQLPPQRPQTPSSSSVLNGTNASIALSSVSSASTLSTVDISQRAMQPPPPMVQEQNANKPPLLPYKFTRNPAEMQGERITATLLKSARGLGITIVGGDDGVEEFLQIKSIVPNGPAWLDGQLQMGDVLVYVNDTCVLGFTHHEMVNVFQSIMPGETVTLEVCRGYPLPFDPNDPNTEVVTTIAVDGISAHEPDKQRRMLMDLNMDGNYNFLDISGASSNGGNKHNLSTGSAIDNSGFILMKKPEVHTFAIIKGAMGFGFTIADSSYGQKVKKILDRACCNQLQEGDILLEINDIVVRNKSHIDVVQILKDCSKTDPTMVKIQRPVTSSTTTANSTSPNSAGQSAAGNNTVAKLRKNFLGATTGGIGNNALFRSKTPTADLYSTMQKEILPIRPKTPLVDTRRARVNTPNIELNEDREVAAVNTSAEETALERSLAESKSHLNEGSKSQNSLSEIDAINHDIPFMDPYPKMVTSLSERLAGVSMPSEALHNNVQQGPAVGGYLRTTASGVPNYENQGDYVSAGSGNYSSIYGLAQMPPVMSPLSGGLYGPPATSTATTAGLMAPASGSYHHHHESCFCYECQDFRNNRLRNSSTTHNLQPPTHSQQQQQPSPRSYYPVYHPPQHGHSQYSPASSASLQAAHIQNERMQKRVNELLNDRRRVGFSPLDHQHHNQMQINTGIGNSTAVGGGYSPSQQQYLHQHPNHGGLMNQPQPQHSPAQQQLGNWSNNGAVNFNALQQAGGLMRNGFPESSDILDGSGEQFVLSEVTLQRQALGFGFRIVGGTEEGSQVTVGHIVPGGAADNDHRITTGDEILSIDGINVVNSSHHKVVSLMGEAALRGQVTMILRRRTRPGMPQHQMQQLTMPPQLMVQQQSMLNNSNMSANGGMLQHPSPLQPLLRNNPVRYPYDVIVTRHENEGFGFVIISSSNQFYGSTIGKLIPGSPADRCGELKVGDRIIAVNRIDIAGMSHGDVVNLIKESGLHVRLTIGCPKEGAIINAAPTMPAGSGINTAPGVGIGTSMSSGGLLLNSAQASPGQVSQTLTPTLQTNLDPSTQYFERPLLSGGSNAGSATSSTSHHQQTAQQSPNPLPAPPQL